MPGNELSLNESQVLDAAANIDKLAKQVAEDIEQLTKYMKTEASNNITTEWAADFNNYLKKYEQTDVQTAVNDIATRSKKLVETKDFVEQYSKSA